MVFNGIRIPSRFSGIRRSPGDDFAADNSLINDLVDYSGEGFIDAFKIHPDKVYQFTDDKDDDNGRVEDKTRRAGRTYRRNQSDQISNYKVQNLRQRSDFCDTLEVMRIRDNKVYVIKTISKKRLAVAQANARMRLSVEFFAAALQSLLSIPRNEMPRVVLPRRIFEDPEAVYFVFDYYAAVQSDAISSAEMKQLYLEAERFIGGIGYRVRNSKTMELAKQAGRFCLVVELGAVKKVEDKALIDANVNILKRNSPTVTNNQKTQGLARPTIRLDDPVLQRYWMDISNIPYTSSSTSQCKMDACDGRIDLYFYSDNQHFAVISTVDNGIRVEIRTDNKIAETYALAELPLQHLVRYRYARRLVACIRRHSVCVEVKSGTRRSRLYADGRFEDIEAVDGITRPGITRANNETQLRAQCERLLRDAR
ncbi:uncharacterized protein V1513DRAFT_65435 [Lipomyces chichibuensis]|uniref:uncharacterized protein n=1 Tax=Lipomyces chichibuensis TaxID=1546026 RepID=UPI00334398C6